MTVYNVAFLSVELGRDASMRAVMARGAGAAFFISLANLWDLRRGEDKKDDTKE